MSQPDDMNDSLSQLLLDQAERQLNYALELTGDDFTASARIRHRLRDIAQMRQKMEL